MLATADSRKTAVQKVGRFKEDRYEDESYKLGSDDPLDFHLFLVPHWVCDGDVAIQQTKENVEEQIGVRNAH